MRERIITGDEIDAVEWAKNHVGLDGAMRRAESTPYLLDLMTARKDPAVEWTVIVMPSQVGNTRTRFPEVGNTRTVFDDAPGG